MLKGFDDHSAYAQCLYALCEGPDKEPILFDGRCNGTIVEPRGSNAFGWDPVFEPEGYKQTFAEMPMEEKNKISHRSKSVDLLKKYLHDNADRLKDQYS